MSNGDRRAQQDHTVNRWVVSTTRWPAVCFGWQDWHVMQVSGAGDKVFDWERV
jgi:hypothetical protein